ncbi:MAG: TRAP transporter substrate-binding protein DctP [Gammaproteobacteria bacterium]|nr:TRAP transporter substrate-binding protein DctP [Gammaproteobacteria bacterium]
MRHLFLALFSSLALALVGCGDSSQQDGQQSDTAGQQTWKFAIEEIEGSVQHQYATEFAKRIEERSNGRISVTVYPYGQLGTSSQLTELAQLGQIQFAMASPGHLGSVIPEVQLFSQHFLFSDDETVNHKVLTSNQPLYDTLGAAYREKNLHLLGIFQEGWMAWTANKAIESPADFEGLKIRTMNSPLLIKAYELYGANPTTMAYSEVYSGLQLNMIDAQVNPVFAIEEMSFYEVQSHLVQGRHLPFIATVVSNPQFFDGLPEPDRKMVMDVKRELDGMIFDFQRELNAKRMDIIREEGDIAITSLSEEQRAAFREASLPIRDEYRKLAGERGDTLLKIVTSAIAAAESEDGQQ